VKDTQADVVILGGGVIGLACALALLRSGRGVTILEKATVGSGSSRGNCGTITPSVLPLNAPGTVSQALRSMFQRDAPFHVRPTLDATRLLWLLRFAGRCNARDFEATARYKAALLLASRAQLESLVRDEGLDCDFSSSGTLYVWRDAQSLAKAEADAALLRSLGVPIEVLDGTATRDKEPTLKSGLAGSHWHPGDACLRPDRYCAELARVVRAAGGLIEEGVAVTRLEHDGDRVSCVRGRGVRNGGVPDERSWAAREVLVATGAWSALLAKQLRVPVPVQPGKGYSITYARPQRAPAIPMILKERSVCVTAWPDGYRLGSTMEFAGYDSSLTRVRLDALARGAAEYLDEPVGPRVEEEWCGFRPMSVDDLPIIGRAPGCRNLSLATGHGMLGVSLSAITGQVVADLLNGRAPGLDIAPMSPGRFRR
jgi:D-amino-acid dehydrogenase